MGRMSWEDYFKTILFDVAKRSTCLRRSVGAIAIKDRRIIATGYNGQIMGSPHCQTCLRQELNIPSGERHEICRAVHAEQNLVAQAAKFGSSIDKAIVMTTTKPCIICYKILCNSGIDKIIYFEDYPDDIVSHEIEANNSFIFKRPDFFVIAKKDITTLDNLF